MPFFDFFTAEAAAAQPQAATTNVVIYIGGGDRIEVPYAEVQGKTIAQVFADNAERLGADARRITRFLDRGTIVPATQVVEAGRIYQGSANIDEKGI